MLFDVRVHVDTRLDPRERLRRDSYFDLTQIEMHDESEAIGYALQLSHECFGLPFRTIRARVLRVHQIIDL